MDGLPQGVPGPLPVQSGRGTHDAEAQNSGLRGFIKRFHRRTKAGAKAKKMAERAPYSRFLSDGFGRQCQKKKAHRLRTRNPVTLPPAP
ncbi:MAG: hypothetical protein KDG89_00580 [Geminicoccaceae bacterium]|nr:hypothetical protein [Geminicoccaceae bacterium]